MTKFNSENYRKAQYIKLTHDVNHPLCDIFGSEPKLYHYDADVYSIHSTDGTIGVFYETKTNDISIVKDGDWDSYIRTSIPKGGDMLDAPVLKALVKWFPKVAEDIAIAKINKHWS